ncbi:hypothetical protein AALB47_12405 [Lachnospiraceae bacterium 54-11]
MGKEKKENTKEEANKFKKELEFLEQHDISTDLEEADLELNTKFQAF